MPMYEYQCCPCGHRFEELVGASQAAPPCPACGSKDVARILSPVCACAPGKSAPGNPAAGPFPTSLGGGCGGGGFS